VCPWTSSFSFTESKEDSAALFQFGEDKLGYFFECFEYADSLNSHSFEDGLAFFLELLGEVGNGHGVGKIPLVELENVGDGIEIQVVLFQVFLKVFHCFEIRIQPLFLGVGYENDPIGTFEDELAAGLIEDLSRNGIKVKARFEAAHGSQIQRKKIEEERAVGLRGQRHHFALLVLPSVVVNPLEVRGFSAQTWTVVDEFAVNFARRKINERHLFLTRVRPQIYSIRGAGRPAFQLCLTFVG
jgi:hypothetical protein